jgi:hypothetical protein
VATHLRLKRLNRTKHAITIYFREHENRREFSLGSFMNFNMMQDVLFVLTMAFKPKLGVSAGGKATITSLLIITSRDYRYLLSDLRTWLVYLQKILEHNEPFMPALMKASTYITVHYRNGIHA